MRQKHIKDICYGSHIIVSTISGEVYSWGRNTWGQIGIGSDEREVSITQQLKDCFNGEKVKEISCGFEHSLALTESGRVFRWGWNAYKQSGVSSIFVFKMDRFLTTHK